VSLIVNHEEHLLRALADTGASSSIILEACNSSPFIKNEGLKITCWIKIGGHFTINQLGYGCDLSLPEFNLKNKYDLLGNFMYMTVLSHQAHMT
jgi:hypothetical protein